MDSLTRRFFYRPETSNSAYGSGTSNENDKVKITNNNKKKRREDNPVVFFIVGVILNLTA